jgi:hypothetical protein
LQRSLVRLPVIHGGALGWGEDHEIADMENVSHQCRGSVLVVDAFDSMLLTLAATDDWDVAAATGFASVLILNFDPKMMRLANDVTSEGHEAARL